MPPLNGCITVAADTLVVDRFAINLLQRRFKALLAAKREILPLFTTVLSVKIVFSCTNKGCRTILSVPTHPDPTPPPRGGVGTLGQIAPNQTNPPTHRPQTHPPTPPSPWGRTTLKQRSGVVRCLGVMFTPGAPPTAGTVLSPGYEAHCFLFGDSKTAKVT